MWLILFAAAAFVAYQVPWFKFNLAGEGTILDYRLSGDYNGYPEILEMTEKLSAGVPVFWVFASVLGLAAALCLKTEAEARAGIVLLTGIATLILTGISYPLRFWLTSANTDVMGDELSVGPDTGFWLMLGLSAAIVICGFVMAALSADPIEQHSPEAHHD